MRRFLLAAATLLALAACKPQEQSSGISSPDYFEGIPGCCEDIVVAQDGSGDFTSIQTAVNSLRTFKPEGRARIFVKNGVYEEKVTIPTHKTDISLIGESRDSTVIIWHDHANIPGPDGVGIGTFQTWTLRVEGPGFICCNLTVVNDAMTCNNPSWWQDREDKVGVGQAVALHVEGDRAVFANCKFLGFQDTIYTGNPDGRELFVDCYVEGTVDFIFGPATVWFENCEIKAIRNGYYTAASTPENHEFGYVFNKCLFTADETVSGEWLGRPWRRYAYTLLKECDIQADIRPEGWHNWNDPENEKTARYLEYKCTGPGSDRSGRAPWSRELSDEEASMATPENVFHRDEDNWLCDNCFGVIAGRKATTDGCVYMAHNEDDGGEQMLNIYNVPATAERCEYLWFEFPGESCADSFMNEYGVCIASDRCASKEDRGKGGVLYEVRTAVAQKAHSAREGVKIVGKMVEKYGYNDTGRSYLIADQKEGWVCSVVRGRHWIAQRVPDDGIMTIPNYYVIGEVNLADTVNFLGSSDIVRYARRRGWYKPRRDGEFNFRLAYSATKDLRSSHNRERHKLAQEMIFGDAVLGDSVVFSRTPVKKIHRRDLSRLLTYSPICNGNTVLTTVFALDGRFPAKKGCCVWVGYPGQPASQQSLWTVGTESPYVCHRYATADEAIEKHFTDVGKFRERWPDHFFWHHVDPSINMDIVPHDYVVRVPKQPRREQERDFTAPGDIYNDHIHVLDDPARGLLYLFWTRASSEGFIDQHVAFSRSSDGGLSWSEPVMIAGSHDRANPTPTAGWQQPMLSRSGRLYCLWNQETTVQKQLCGEMFGRYSDDGGQSWSEPEQVVFPMRADSDPQDPSIPPSWCNWQRPLRLGEGGRYLVGCSRHGKAPYDERENCKVEFWQYENIDDDPEVHDIRISFFSTGRDSFDATKIVTDREYMPREGPAVEEASITGLPDGRLFALMRSSLGHPVWSVSEDGGRSWSTPKLLRDHDGGRAYLHPRSPCPIYDVNGPEARSGEYFALVHDSFDFNGITAYQNRGPIHVIRGKFVPDAEQPIWFHSKEVFSPREGGNSVYASYTPADGGGTLWFNDEKYYIFGKRFYCENAGNQ